jgi:hypothetical protein
MRPLRELANNVWYDVHTAVNNRVPLFLLPQPRVSLEQVLCDARGIYVFELRGLRFKGAWILFYIKPADGYQLPEIMQWIKQTFATRINVLSERTGHIWGERYWSQILIGEPPSDAEVYLFDIAVRLANRNMRKAANGRGAGAGGIPATGVRGCPRPGNLAANIRLPPVLPHRYALRFVIRR